jgi:hypothetical protein
MQPGLRKLAEGSVQFTPTDPASPHLREKLAVLRSQPEQALQTEAGFDALPALHAAMRQAAREHPAALDCLPTAGWWPMPWAGRPMPPAR